MELNLYAIKIVGNIVYEISSSFDEKKVLLHILSQDAFVIQRSDRQPIFIVSNKLVELQKIVNPTTAQINNSYILFEK